MSRYVLAIDEGTTCNRAILFDAELQAAGLAQQELAQHFPRPGWVEHDPEEIWQSTVSNCKEALAAAGAEASAVAAIGITNQRETTLLWDRKTAKPVNPAIVWQDRRTAGICARLKEEGHEEAVAATTGLLLDPYFSGTKLTWLLDNVEGARARAEDGKLAFGTVDTWLLWRLTGGKVHATDATNASRTLLYDIHEGRWDEDMLELFGVPAAVLPEVKDCAANFGVTDPAIFGGAIAVTGIAGDQQAATVGQACFEPGMMKSTYGTGCFALLVTGADAVASTNRLLSTIAYQLEGKTVYALEGSIFVAGAAVQWLRDGLGILDKVEQSGELAASADPEQDVYMVPAFAGLGAPYWDANARGALFGLTRATGGRELARAVLESVCYQTRDLLEAMRRDWTGAGDTVLRVDGGMVASDWTMQFLADILNAPVDRPKVHETTALGAAYLAGFQAGLYPEPAKFADTWSLDRRFEPQMSAEERERKYAGWQDAVRRTLSAGPGG